MRKAKIRKLRERYGAAKSSTQKEQVIAKSARVAPWLSVEALMGKKK
ncbi:MAG: hypothetical protein G01um101425_950 [Candidatus Peregrinibacteria bacterium Gr01-1014_25]|nr:MAG: hypothetical protein G01um101425_950 [Candidatus Peregrinibacteria bacterium Gr01-1014_25]